MDQATARCGGKLWIIILAAGASRRFGTTKQLLRLRGRTLLAMVLRRAAQLAPGRVVAVIGADSQRLRGHIRRTAPNTRIVYNRNWELGMGTTLATGIRALPRAAAAALVLLSDQPDAGTRALQRLCRRRARDTMPVIASRYAGRLGVPAIFARRTFGALRTLDADYGARELLNADAPPFRIIAVDMPEAAWDIDTTADLKGRLS